MPFALCIMIAFVKGLDLEAIKLGYAYAPSQRAFLWRIYLPYLGPGMLTGFVAVALLTMGDVSTVHLLMPPGMEPFSIKIYNYLHYGANDVVADCCFMILLTMLLVMVGIISYFERTGCKTAES